MTNETCHLHTFQGPTTPTSYAARFATPAAIDQEITRLTKNVDRSDLGVMHRFGILVSALRIRQQMLIGSAK